MKYYVEKYYPLTLAILVTLAFYFQKDKVANVEITINKLLDTALTISGTLLGFLLTIVTLINTIETRKMRFVRESGNMPLLNHYLKIALTLNIISISIYFIFPILSSFLFINNIKSYTDAFVVFIVSYTWIANVRFAKIFISLLIDAPPK